VLKSSSDDGNNAIENIFDLDDTHYRISCENSLSADLWQFGSVITEVVIKKDSSGRVTGLILEARIALKTQQSITIFRS
jgi:hypothetical protein